MSTAGPYANETKEKHDARMLWWREARFGMFIHWGVYTQLAGSYNGKQIENYAEWIMQVANIPVLTTRSSLRFRKPSTSPT